MRRKRRFLMVAWAAGGNVVPAAGLAGRLCARGHEVRVLGPPVLRKRFEQAGCVFRPLERAHEPHPIEDDVLEDNVLAWTRFIAGTRLADDVTAELDRAPAEVVVSDAFLSAALSAGENAGIPTVALVHVLYEPSIEGPIATQWDSTRPVVDRTRKHLNLGALDADSPLVAAVWRNASLVLACMPEPFDYPLADSPANVRYVGPIFEDARAPWQHPERPLVLVGFSTTEMRQAPVLQRVLDALQSFDVDVLCTLGGVRASGLRPPANAAVCDWVPHAAVLPRTSAVVTHGGLSTVMSALTSGVPLVCMPMGRDQPLNADRVEALHLGLHIPSEASVASIQSAIEVVLADPGFRRRAQGIAEIIAGYGNGSQAVSELEAL